jgi:hypothetical protein
MTSGEGKGELRPLSGKNRDPQGKSLALASANPKNRKNREFKSCHEIC